MKLTEYDYAYLKGDRGTWPIWNGEQAWRSAYNVVSEDCRHAGYGEFGQPTTRGKLAMAEYEDLNDG